MRWRLGLATMVIAGATAGLLLPAAPGTTARPTTTPQRFEGVLTPLVLERADLADVVLLPPGSPPPTPGLIVDPATPPAPDARPDARQPAPRAKVQPKATPTPRITTSHALRGSASWYCRAGVSPCTAAHPDRSGVADMYAAAGPALRRAICGSDRSDCWRGRRVLVNGTLVVLADWCQCYKGERHEKVIDLYWDAWIRVPGVTGGVTVRW